MAIAGDLRADGYDDIAVGTPFGSEVHVYYATSGGVSSSPDVPMTDTEHTGGGPDLYGYDLD